MSPERDKIWYVGKVCDFPLLTKEKDQQTMDSSLLLSPCHFPMATYSPSYPQLPISSEIPNTWIVSWHTHQLCGRWRLLYHEYTCKCLPVTEQPAEPRFKFPALHSYTDTYPNWIAVHLVPNLIAIVRVTGDLFMSKVLAATAWKQQAQQ